VGEPPDSDRTAILGFHPVHRVAQSYLGSLWIALDKREGEPGKPALLRQLQLPANTPLEARQGIARAARDALELRHPNVLSVLEVLEHGESLVLAYEHAEAEPLRSLQSWANLRGLSFPVGVTLKIVSDLLLGVEATHAASGAPAIASPFGGLSPDSVLVSRSGETRLCDPLIASCATLLEGVGFNTAKLAYAAPEQVHAVAPLTPPSDVFTCGAILWELLATRRLLSGSRVAIERKLLEHNLPSLSSNLRSDHQLPSGLLELVDRALSGDAAKRPQTAAALREELESCGHEIASLEQVAQFVGKLSGQRFDRRSAAVRSKSLPELEAPLEWPVDVPVSNTSARRGGRAGPPPSSNLIEGRRTPAERAIQGAAERAIQGAAEPPASSAAPTPPAASRAAESSVTTPAARRPVPLPPAPAQSRRTAPTVPNLPASLRPPGAVATTAPPVTAEPPASVAKPPLVASPAAPVVASVPASVRKGPPGLIEPPPIPEQSLDEDDDGPTRTDQKPEDWWEPEPFAPAISAAPVQAAVSAAPVAKVDLRRTAMGMGAPPPRAPAGDRPVLAVSRPFANLTPEPFAAPAANPPSAPASAAPASAGPESLPPLPSAGLPPSSATTPDAAVPSSVPATSLGPRPLRLPALEGLDPKFHLVSEELVPRVAPSGRVTPRARSGWAHALRFRPGTVGNARALIAGGLACVALAAAVVLVLMLRPKADATLGSEPALAAQRAAATQELPGATEPGAPSVALPDTGVPEPEPAPVPAPATPPGAPGATAAEFSGIGLDSAKLLDNQLLSLFALERRTTLPSCVEPASARTRGKAKAKSKSKAARTRDAQAQLKAARKELMRGKNEKAHQLLCAATLRDPTNVAAQQALAELALQLGDPVQAQAAVERALERKPEDPTLLGLLGDTLAVGGDLPGSRRAWLKSAPGKGSEPERLLRLTDTYRKIGDRTLRSSSYAAACTYYRRAVVLSAGNYVPSIGLSEALRRLRQAPAALAWAQRAAHALPEDPRVQVLFGDALYDTGRKDEARLAWQAAWDAQPSNAIAARRLAKGKP
jgi:serine/threonine protein kinase/tetratricopeptide (TPR) repeat protein